MIWEVSWIEFRIVTTKRAGLWVPRTLQVLNLLLNCSVARRIFERELGNQLADLVVELVLGVVIRVREVGDVVLVTSYQH